jgi:tetratricopeptide (TPR) repeat protein
LAAALWNRDRIDESTSHNRRALELNPNLIDARFNLGWALLKKGAYDEAVAQFEDVLRLNPQHERAQKALSSAKQMRDNSKNQP